jgi:hypothetical protein
LTRVSTGAGLYLATSLLLMSCAARAVNSHASGSQSSRTSYPKIGIFLCRLFSPRSLVPAAILLGFAGLCGFVNYERWGNPLTFTDLRINVYYILEPKRLVSIEQYGSFNIIRLWYGALYYFFPITFIVGPDGKYLFEDLVANLYDRRELPPSSFLISDPFLLVLATYFLWTLTTRAGGVRIDRWNIAALMAGFAAPIFMILTFFYTAFRYRGEFYAFLNFTALLGFHVLGKENPASLSSADNKFRRLLVWSAAIGIIASYLLLIAYKVTPGRGAVQFLDSGLIKVYYWALANWLNDPSRR